MGCDVISGDVIWENNSAKWRHKKTNNNKYPLVAATRGDSGGNIATTNKERWERGGGRQRGRGERRGWEEEITRDRGLGLQRADQNSTDQFERSFVNRVNILEECVLNSLSVRIATNYSIIPQSLVRLVVLYLINLDRIIRTGKRKNKSGMKNIYLQIKK